MIELKNINSSIVSRLSKEIFIYPTDTIYGIGCNAEDKKLVGKIRILKGRGNKPFSIIAPNTEWILKNCQTTESKIKKFLPGQYTLILKKKKKNFLKHVSKTEFLGVRIPDHPMTKILQKTNKPIITTSVNLSAEKPANKISEINKTILKKINLIINAGTLSGKPSKIVKQEKIIKR